MTNEDIQEIKTVLKEQLDSLERLGKIPLPLGSVPTDKYQEIITIYNTIIECNKVMSEIINGPNRIVEIMV